MNKFAYKIAAAVSGGALAFALLAPNAFAADLEITDNGAGSTNSINVVSVSDCTVSQKANTNVRALVGASASTGGNNAIGNTGGTTSITTGDATATATVIVTGGTNTATNPCCCDTQCEGGALSAKITDNGAGSTNTVNEVSVKSSTIRQRARTSVGALVKAKAKTGKNNAIGNMGSGTTINTGASTSTSDLTVTGGVNTLN